MLRIGITKSHFVNIPAYRSESTSGRSEFELPHTNYVAVKELNLAQQVPFQESKNASSSSRLETQIGKDNAQ